jgi:hypothetical protein
MVLVWSHRFSIMTLLLCMAPEIHLHSGDLLHETAWWTDQASMPSSARQVCFHLLKIFSRDFASSVSFFENI